MTMQDDIARRQAIGQALQKAASFGVDATGLKGKSLGSLIEFFHSYEKYQKDLELAEKRMDELKFSASTLARYGISRSTIEHNPVLTELVQVIQKKQDVSTVTLTKKEYDDIKGELARLQMFHENAIDLGIKNIQLQLKLDKVTAKKNRLLAVLNKHRAEDALNIEGARLAGLDDFDELLDETD